MKVELVDHKPGEEQCWAQEKKAFLESEEFFDFLGSHSVVLFEYDFEGATQRFKEVGCPPERMPPNFLDLHKALDNIPQEKFRTN